MSSPPASSSSEQQPLQQEEQTEKPPVAEPLPEKEQPQQREEPGDSTGDRAGEGDRLADENRPSAEGLPADTPRVTQLLPAVPAPERARPTLVVPPPPQRATAAQMVRIAEYYGTRFVMPLGARFSVDGTIDGRGTAVRYVIEGLRAGGIAPGMAMIPVDTDAGTRGTYRARLDVAISGDRAPSAEHFYSRAILRLTYHTGPGKRLVAETHIQGPYRLSQVSSSDALLRSLSAVRQEVYAQALTFLDEEWIAEVPHRGLPYRIETIRPETMGPETMGPAETPEIIPIFEIPPQLESYLARYTRLLHHQYTIDPLTGIITIIYNGDT